MKNTKQLWTKYCYKDTCKLNSETLLRSYFRELKTISQLFLCMQRPNIPSKSPIKSHIAKY